jgi:hypothetical protein
MLGGALAGFLKVAAALAVPVLCLLALTPISSATAQQETWPYRYTLEGPDTFPETFAPDKVFVYTIRYALVEPESTQSPSFALIWPQEAASLRGTATLEPPTGITTSVPGGQHWEIAGTPQQGRAVFLLQVDPTFSGDFTVSIVVADPDAVFPEGSVTTLTTHVTGEALSPALAPSTGGGSAATSSVHGALAALAVAAALLTAAGLTWQRARR